MGDHPLAGVLARVRDGAALWATSAAATARSAEARRRAAEGARRAVASVSGDPAAAALAYATGAVTFRASLHAANVAAHAIRVCSRQRIVGPPLAALGVGAAGVVACDAFKHAYGLVHRRSAREALDELERRARRVLAEPRRSAERLAEVALGFDTRERRFYAFGTVVAAAASAGTLRRYLPSDLSKRGAFNAGYLPDAPYKAYADKRERRKVQRLGRRHGCHHCGARFRPAAAGRTFVADHIPPNKYAEGRKQRFYPQCERCCGLQARAVATDVRKLVTHRGTRLYHAFWPLPLLWHVAGAYVNEFADRVTDERRRRDVPWWKRLV